MIRLSGLIDLAAIKLVEDHNWIKTAITKPGALKQQLGVPADETIPTATLKTAATKGGKLGKRARLAMTLKKLKEQANISEKQSIKVDELVVQLEAMDSVDKKDGDVDNDGDKDSSDKYLQARRDAIGKAMNKNEEIGPKDQADKGEYDYEGDMAKNQLQTIIRNAQMLHDMLADETNLPEWVQSKITLAKEYVESAAQYINSEKDQVSASIKPEMNMNSK